MAPESNPRDRNSGKQTVNLALTVLEIVAPVFLLAAIGFAWVRLGFEYRTQFVMRLALSLSMPCLIFMSLVRIEASPEALAALSGATLAAYGAIGVAVFAVVSVLGLNRRTYLAPLIFGNTGNLGLPLALFAFGETGLGLAVVMFALMVFMQFTAGMVMVTGRASPKFLLREPFVAATVLGALFLWQDWAVPRFMANTLDLIGQMSIPLMILTLGAAVARLTPGRVGLALALALAKLAICVPVGWIVGRWFALDQVAFGVLVLQVSTPVAVTAYLLAEKYEADGEAVAGLVVFSTLISVAALPLLLAALL